MYMALTRAIAKIEKQALKLKKKTIDRKQGARATAKVAPAPTASWKLLPGHRVLLPRAATRLTNDAEEAALSLTRKRINSSSFAMPIRIASACSINEKTEILD